MLCKYLQYTPLYFRLSEFSRAASGRAPRPFRRERRDRHRTRILPTQLRARLGCARQVRPFTFYSSLSLLFFFSLFFFLSFYLSISLFLSRLQLSAFYNRHISHTFLDVGAAEFLAHRIHDPHAALGPESDTGAETGASAASPLAEPPPRPKPIVKRVLNYAVLDPLHLQFPLLSSFARTGCTAVPNESFLCIILIYCACIVSVHYRYKIKHYRVAQNCGSIAVQMYCTGYYCLQSDQRPRRREMESSRRARGPPPQYSVCPRQRHARRGHRWRALHASILVSCNWRMYSGPVLIVTKMMNEDTKDENSYRYMHIRNKFISLHTP